MYQYSFRVYAEKTAFYDDDIEDDIAYIETSFPGITVKASVVPVPNTEEIIIFINLSHEYTENEILRVWKEDFAECYSFTVDRITCKYSDDPDLREHDVTELWLEA